MTLDDDDPHWQQHDGGSGHRDHPEWSGGDGGRAATFYSGTSGRARSLLDLLIDHPGEQLDAHWLADQLAGESANGLARPQLVARAFGDMREAQAASGRRYPFYWWRADGSPTRYAMKHSVAELFRQARRGTSAAHAARSYWWDTQPGENVYMEITRRDDMGRAAVSLFPRLRAVVEEAEAQSSSLAGFSPVEQAAEAVEGAAGKIAGHGRGQGFQLDQASKVAVEVHAMNAAAEFYGDSWSVEDVHGRESYDLVCRRDDEEMRVEVKGTTTGGAEVILTRNEVEHARSYRRTALFILSNIRLERAEDGTVVATGGIRHVCDPWRIDDGALIPIGFRYQPPRI